MCHFLGPEGVARGEDALGVLENSQSRSQFIDELMEVNRRPDPCDSHLAHFLCDQTKLLSCAGEANNLLANSPKKERMSDLMSGVMIDLRV